MAEVSYARRVVLAALVLGLGLLLARGLSLTRYSPESSDSYVFGAFHVHSTLSDGLAPIEDIAREAKEARVGFVMMSDHGAPHPEAATMKRTIDGVRFIGGSEVGIPDGHLIVSDVDELPRYTLPPFPPDAVSDVAAWGGLSIVTYPEDPVHRWGYWEPDLAPDGIEIVNVTSYFRRSSLRQKLSWAFFSFFNRNYYISGFEAPTEALARWDELLSRGRVLGFYAANAHGGFPLTEERTIGIPSYRTAMGYVGLAVVPRYRETPEKAIRRGEFFSLVRAAGEPKRFELTESEGALVVRLNSATSGARIDLKRNGVVVGSTKENELRMMSPGPGVYRVEVYLENHPLLAEDVPWILSNPLFVGSEGAPVKADPLACGVVEPVALAELRLEMDDESKATIEHEASGALRLSYRLSQKTPEKIDRWVALALRKPMDLSSYRGIEIRGGSPAPMRYWIEVRSGEDGHYASVLLPTSGAIAIPWERFYPTLGAKRAIPLGAIDALFVTVNTSSSRTGFSSELTLGSLGFCR
jgi:hypothetical protein